MENLTKQQIVLVTLLVSFVTSIATGIVTVALMDQAPPGVTQTINRVVEKTVERVIQTPAQTAAVVTKETVVVKEDDLVVAAIEKTTPSLVRVIKTLADGSTSVEALGLVLTKDGVIAVSGAQVIAEESYSARFFNGKTYTLKLTFSDEENGFVLYKIVPPGNEKPSFVPSELADSDKLKLGQTVVFLGGLESNRVEVGIISNLKTVLHTGEGATSTPTSDTPRVNAVLTTIEARKSGGVLVSLSGDVVAFGTSDNTEGFLPSNLLTQTKASYTDFVASGSSPTAE